MLFRWADNRDPNSWASEMRRRRVKLFCDLLVGARAPLRILDVGGTVEFWKQNASELPERCEITLLNLTETSTEGVPNLRSIAGDARKMAMFSNDSFDVAFSNSVIEHVGTFYDQMAMAKEIQRVAKTYFVQTPNRYFPIEPHFVFPLWQFLPLCFRAWMLRRTKLGWMQKQPDYFRARAEVEQIRLLSEKDLKALFPEAKIHHEKIGPCVKSLIAIKKASDQ